MPGQPNRIRAVRTRRRKFALYFDPEGKAPTEYELYDLERDPDESDEPGRPDERRAPGRADSARFAPSSASGSTR